MDKIIQNIQKRVLFPHNVGYGKIRDGYIYKILPICKSCSQSCIKNYHELEVHTFNICPNGLSVYLSQIGEKKILITGLYLKGYIAKMPRKKKKSISDDFLDKEVVLSWERETNLLIKEIESYKERQVKSNLSMFHDITPSISLIFRSVETIINTFEGDTFDDKVENAPHDFKTLYHSIDLLKNRIRIMPMILNPESVKYGQLSKCSLYKIFDKVKRLFTSTARISKNKIQIESNKFIEYEPFVYDSFMTLPFVLVENAVKYSKKGNNIIIRLNESNRGISVAVESYGPTVGEGNEELIFSNGFKDPNAVKFSSKGSGIGLFLAQYVAEAHNFEIKYSRKECETENSIYFGYNTFSFFVKKQ